jgi:hypothetical protein
VKSTGSFLDNVQPLTITARVTEAIRVTRASFGESHRPDPAICKLRLAKLYLKCANRYVGLVLAQMHVVASLMKQVWWR